MKKAEAAPGPWYLYILHFSEPFKHAKHYLGITNDPERRLREHQTGQGGRLPAVVREHGIDFTMDILGEFPDYSSAKEKEKYYKDIRKNSPKICPKCKEQRSQQMTANRKNFVIDEEGYFLWGKKKANHIIKKAADILDLEGKVNWPELINDIAGDLLAEGFTVDWEGRDERATMHELVMDWLEQFYANNSEVAKNHFIDRYGVPEEQVDNLIAYLDSTYSELLDIDDSFDYPKPANKIAMGPPVLISVSINSDGSIVSKDFNMFGDTGANLPETLDGINNYILDKLDSDEKSASKGENMQELLKLFKADAKALGRNAYSTKEFKIWLKANNIEEEVKEIPGDSLRNWARRKKEAYGRSVEIFMALHPDDTTVGVALPGIDTIELPGEQANAFIQEGWGEQHLLSPENREFSGRTDSDTVYNALIDDWNININEYLLDKNWGEDITNEDELQAYFDSLGGSRELEYDASKKAFESTDIDTIERIREFLESFYGQLGPFDQWSKKELAHLFYGTYHFTSQGQGSKEGKALINIIEKERWFAANKEADDKRVVYSMYGPEIQGTAKWIEELWETKLNTLSEEQLEEFFSIVNRDMGEDIEKIIDGMWSADKLHYHQNGAVLRAPDSYTIIQNSNIIKQNCDEIYNDITGL